MNLVWIARRELLLHVRLESYVSLMVTHERVRNT